jgi:hypothetical protein
MLIKLAVQCLVSTCDLQHHKRGAALLLSLSLSLSLLMLRRSDLPFLSPTCPDSFARYLGSSFFRGSVSNARSLCVGT